MAATGPVTGRAKDVEGVETCGDAVVGVNDDLLDDEHAATPINSSSVPMMQTGARRSAGMDGPSIDAAMLKRLFTGRSWERECARIGNRSK
jgi:hypothetical protein